MMAQNLLGGRLPLVNVAELDPAQYEMLAYLEATKLPWAKESGFKACLPNGSLIGPFNAFLHSPQIGRSYMAWVDAESSQTSLAPDVRQVVILTVGVAWHAAYEIYAHIAVARKAGVDEATIDAVRLGQEPVGAPNAVITAWRFTRELVETQSVSSAVYQTAVTIFGDRGLVDMVHLIGQYLATCALLNAFEVPVPE
jgi:4-carboxymuconolactone decarboxylase